MQQAIEDNLLFIIPVVFLVYSIGVIYMIALCSGWRFLAKRFRTQNAFPSTRWNMQSASLRFMSHYNGCLTVGADSSGLYVVPFILLRMWHPPLFIPWSEISFQRKKWFFFINVLELRLGQSESVPFTVYARLGAKIEAAAGPNWPSPYYRAPDVQPPPIG